MPVECDDAANPWIREHFKDCIYTSRDFVGFLLGLASIGIWICAQVGFAAGMRSRGGMRLSTIRPAPVQSPA